MSSGNVLGVSLLNQSPSPSGGLNHSNQIDYKSLQFGESIDTLLPTGSAKLLCYGEKKFFYSNSGEDSSIRIFDMTNKLVTKSILKGHVKTVESMTFASPGILISGNKNEIRIWNLLQQTSKILISSTPNPNSNLVGDMFGGPFVGIQSPEGMKLLSVGGATLTSFYLLNIQEEVRSLKWKNTLDEVNSGVTTFVDLSHCNLQDFDASVFSDPKSIEAMDLSWNHISVLPYEIRNFRSLQSLVISHNALFRLGSDLAKVSKLKLLHADHNNLASVSSAIGKLTKLESLLLGSNELQQIPGDVGFCQQLDLLDLSQNKLDCLPASLGALKQLTTLFLHDNLLGASSPSTNDETQDVTASTNSTTNNMSLDLPPSSPRDAIYATPRSPRAGGLNTSAPGGLNSSSSSVSAMSIPIGTRNLSLKPTISSREVTSPRAAITSAKTPSSPPASSNNSPSNASVVTPSVNMTSTHSSAASIPTAANESLTASKDKKKARRQSKRGTDLSISTSKEGNSSTPTKESQPTIVSPRTNKSSKSPSPSSPNTNISIPKAQEEDSGVTPDIMSPRSPRKKPKQSRRPLPNQSESDNTRQRSGSSTRMGDENGGTAGTKQQYSVGSLRRTARATAEARFSTNSKRSAKYSDATSANPNGPALQNEPNESDIPPTTDDASSPTISNEPSPVPKAASTTGESSETPRKKTKKSKSQIPSPTSPPQNTASIERTASTTPKTTTKKSFNLQLSDETATDHRPSTGQTQNLTSTSRNSSAASLASSSSKNTNNNQSVVSKSVSSKSTNANLTMVIQISQATPNASHPLLSADAVKNQVYLEDFDFSQLSSLKLLHLQANNIIVLPSSLSSCQSLTDLDLAENRIYEFSTDLSNLPSLTRLNLSVNCLTSIPNSLGSMSNLRQLLLDDNEISHLPLNFSMLKNLSSLHISHNKLNELPAGFGKLPKMTELNLSFNVLEIFPSELTSLAPLRFLAIDGNKINSIPKEILFMTSLQSLEARDNRLTSIPFSSLLHVECLQFDNNQITAVPMDVIHLNAVADLSFSGNPLKEIPEEIGFLPKLLRLDLSNTAIVHFPESICMHRNLKKLILDGNNQMTWPSPEMVEGKETESILSAMIAERFPSTKPNNTVKLCLVGLEGSGKTSLCAQLKSGKPLKKSAARPTRGIGFDSFTAKIQAQDVGQKSSHAKIQFNVWDFSGNEEYRILHHLFILSESIYMVVWNLALDESRSQIPDWLNTIRCYAGDDVPIIIVGTHMDNMKDCSQVVESLEKKYVNSRWPNVRCVIPISNLTGNNISKLMKKLGQLTENMLMSNSFVPTSVFKFASSLPKEVSQSVPSPIMEMHNFEKILNKHGLDSSSSAVAIRYLRNIGSIVDLQTTDFEDLSGIIVDPEWFVKIYSDILAYRSKYIVGGSLKHSQLEAIWKDSGLPSVAHYTLIAVLHKLEICFDDGSHYQKSSRNFYSNISIFPIFLPDNQPTGPDQIQQHVGGSASSSLSSISKPIKPGQQEIVLLYRLSFVPVSFMGKMMTRLFRQLRAISFWKNGFVIQSMPDVLQPTAEPEMTAIVELSQQNDIKVSIRGIRMWSCHQIFQNVLYSVLASFRCPPKIAFQSYLHCAFKTSREQNEIVAITMHKVKYEISKGASVLQLTNGGQIPLTSMIADMKENHGSNF